MNPLRSVGARLGLALAVVVAGALILVDLIVVPSLERNLINANLTRLEEAAPTAGSRLLLSSSYALDDTIQSAASSADAIRWRQSTSASTHRSLTSTSIRRSVRCGFAKRAPCSGPFSVRCALRLGQASRSIIAHRNRRQPWRQPGAMSLSWWCTQRQHCR